MEWVNKMKKVISSILCCILMLFITSCDKKEEGKNLEVNQALEYIDSLSSYELACKMTVNRGDKSINLDIDVSYLKPGYYKVCFNNSNGNKQFIVKNDSGVFVLNPSLNKEFKFDSEWPLNSTHAYLLEGIKNDIKADSSYSYELSSDNVIINAKLNNQGKAKALKFYYDLKNNKPVKAIVFDENNKEIITVTFNSFTPNKTINKELFSEKLIMDDNTPIKDAVLEEEEEKSLIVTCGYIIDGSSLNTQTTKDDCTILCYTGDVSYTVVVSKPNVYNELVFIDSINCVDYLENGLLVSNELKSIYYIDDYEISIYHNGIEIEDVIAISQDISLA